MIRMSMPCRRASQLSAAVLASLLVASQVPAAQIPGALANDGWNPFAEQDRAAARKAARERRRQSRSDADRGPADRDQYLAPIAPGEPPASQPYPATAPGYRANNTYQPPGVASATPPRSAPGAVPGSVPYGAPGPYVTCLLYTTPSPRD